MHLILLAVSIFMAIVGIVLIRYGVPLDEYGNSPLLMSGMVALVGGLLLFALFLVVRALHRIVDRLEIQPMPLPPIADIAHAAPPPRPAAPAPSVRLEPVPPPAAEVATPEPRVEPRVEVPPAQPRVDVPAAQPRVEQVPPPPAGKSSLFGWLAGGKPRAPEAISRKSAPAEPARVDPEPQPQPAPDPMPHLAAVPAGNGAAPPKPTEVAAGAAVYKSGVIDGMAYTLYTDGSIEAQLPQGAIRFASVEALQAYLVGR